MVWCTSSQSLTSFLQVSMPELFRVPSHHPNTHKCQQVQRQGGCARPSVSPRHSRRQHRPCPIPRHGFHHHARSPSFFARRSPHLVASRQGVQSSFEEHVSGVSGGVAAVLQVLPPRPHVVWRTKHVLLVFQVLLHHRRHRHLRARVVHVVANVAMANGDATVGDTTKGKRHPRSRRDPAGSRFPHLKGKETPFVGSRREKGVPILALDGLAGTILCRSEDRPGYRVSDVHLAQRIRSVSPSLPRSCISRRGCISSAARPPRLLLFSRVGGSWSLDGTFEWPFRQPFDGVSHVVSHEHNVERRALRSKRRRSCLLDIFSDA